MWAGYMQNANVLKINLNCNFAKEEQCGVSSQDSRQKRIVGSAPHVKEKTHTRERVDLLGADKPDCFVVSTPCVMCQQDSSLSGERTGTN